MVTANERDEYPRVLVFGVGFDSYSGGGITLSNLFRGWPVSRLAVADFAARGGTAAVAGDEYRLGTREQAWVWPFSHFARRAEQPESVDKLATPGILAPSADLHRRTARSALERTMIRASRARFRQGVDWLGAGEVLRQSTLSQPLRKWVQGFSPDVIYCQLSSLHTIRLVRELHDYTGAKVAIHIMDDWPETIYRGTLLRPWVRTLVDREFRELLSHTAVRLAISRAMADEYLGRYGFEFGVFHNCIDVSWWREFRKTSWTVGSPLRVVYSGRIGWDALMSFRDVSEAVEQLNQAGLPTQFRIHSPELGTPGALALMRYPHTIMLPAAEHEELPALLTGADVLIIPSDFEGWGRRFARLSMPTKVPAYMASGTPVLLYSPRTHATCAWAEHAKWALVVGERGPAQLAQKLTDLAASPALRETLGRRASEMADREFDGRRVRAAFKDALAGRSCSNCCVANQTANLVEDA
jgi:glycosyltransferase involved in cell wall biosynthesis